MIIRFIQPTDLEEWLRMRLALWPHHDPQELRSEMEDILAEQTSQPVFVAERPTGGLGGFLEASTHVNTYGCETSPVGYIEGWYVDPDLRLQGVGKLLVRAAEQWAIGQGYQEMASDCEIDNLVSLHAHLAIGYAEADRLIHFHKWIGDSSHGIL
jgi:aminoglycoside 6'-N-acetyltransferase I